MPERDIFGAFAREHSKYIYFLLAAAAGATVYALGELDGPLGAADTKLSGSRGLVPPDVSGP